MEEGTIDYKRLELMLKESDKKWEKNLSRLDQKWEKDLFRIEGKLDAIVAEIKVFLQETLKNGPATTMVVTGTEKHHNESIRENLVAVGGSLEVIWQSSKSMGSSSQIFAEAFSENNEPTPNFYFEVNDDSPIVQDDINLFDYNDQDRVNDFVGAATDAKNAMSKSCPLKTADHGHHDPKTPSEFPPSPFSAHCGVPFAELTNKCLDRRQCFWCVSRLKKLMVLIGNSVHCLCVMICLQVWKQWQFGIGVRCNEDTKQLLFVGIIVHWFPIFFPLRTRVLRRGEAVMKKWEQWRLKHQMMKECTWRIKKVREVSWHQKFVAGNWYCCTRGRAYMD